MIDGKLVGKWLSQVLGTENVQPVEADVDLCKLAAAHGAEQLRAELEVANGLLLSEVLANVDLRKRAEKAEKTIKDNFERWKSDADRMQKASDEMNEWVDKHSVCMFPDCKCPVYDGKHCIPEETVTVRVPLAGLTIDG